MKLREIRESKGISQRQAAIALNLSPTVYNRYETGIREPSNVILLTMANYFGVTVDEILGRDISGEYAQIMSAEEKQMLNQFNHLSPENRVRVEAYLEGLLASQEN